MTAIIRKDDYGVLLRYETDVAVPKRRALWDEAERILRAEVTFNSAEAALIALEVILGAVSEDLTDLVWPRIVNALDVVYEALEIRRTGIMSMDDRAIERAA